MPVFRKLEIRLYVDSLLIGTTADAVVWEQALRAAALEPLVVEPTTEPPAQSSSDD